MEEPFTGILHILLMMEDGDFLELVSFSAMTNTCKSDALYNQFSAKVVNHHFQFFTCENLALHSGWMT